MERPNKEELLAIIKLEGTPEWEVFRKWLRRSLSQCFDPPDAGVCKGMAFQLVAIIDIIAGAREALHEITKEE